MNSLGREYKKSPTFFAEKVHPCTNPTLALRTIPFRECGTICIVQGYSKGKQKNGISDAKNRDICEIAKSGIR